MKETERKMRRLTFQIIVKRLFLISVILFGLWLLPQNSLHYVKSTIHKLDLVVQGMQHMARNMIGYNTPGVRAESAGEWARRRSAEKRRENTKRF